MSSSHIQDTFTSDTLLHLAQYVEKLCVRQYNARSDLLEMSGNVQCGIAFSFLFFLSNILG